MTNKLNFANWLKLANEKEYKIYLQNPRAIERRFVRAYIEYLHNFKCGITKVNKIKNSTGMNWTNAIKHKGNTTRHKKYLPFLSF